VPHLLGSADIEVMVNHHLFGLVDSDADTDVPEPTRVAPWMRAGTSAVYVESEQDVVWARLQLECWNDPAPFDREMWPDSVVVALEMPSGVITVDEITAGVQADVFTLPAPGRYRVRVAWREVEAADGGAPEGLALVQFWPAC
jgi:hypothetical protein